MTHMRDIAWMRSGQEGFLGFHLELWPPWLFVQRCRCLRLEWQCWSLAELSSGFSSLGWWQSHYVVVSHPEESILSKKGQHFLQKAESVNWKPHWCALFFFLRCLPTEPKSPLQTFHTFQQGSWWLFLPQCQELRRFFLHLQIAEGDNCLQETRALMQLLRGLQQLKVHPGLLLW